MNYLNKSLEKAGVRVEVEAGEGSQDGMGPRAGKILTKLELSTKS